jgi:hypothetical protein
VAIKSAIRGVEVCGVSDMDHECRASCLKSLYIAYGEVSRSETIQEAEREKEEFRQWKADRDAAAMLARGVALDARKAGSKAVCDSDQPVCVCSICRGAK